MLRIDISVVLNIHQESLYLAPTLKSLVDCVNVVNLSENLNIELVAVFDNSNSETISVFESADLSSFSKVSVLNVHLGSLSLSRNAGIEIATGQYIWTADADDLVSSNALLTNWTLVKQSPEKQIAIFPEYVLSFGNYWSKAKYFDSDLLTPADFAFMNPYTSRIFINREALIQIPYRYIDNSSGFAFEDWDLNARLYAIGYKFIVSPNTVLFYRISTNSMLRQAILHSEGLPPHSKLFNYETFRDIQKRRIQQSKGKYLLQLKRRKSIKQADGSASIDISEIEKYIAESAEHEPSIYPWGFTHNLKEDYLNIPANIKHWGFSLDKLLESLSEGNFTDVVIFDNRLFENIHEFVFHEISKRSSSEHKESKFLFISSDLNKFVQNTSIIPVKSKIIEFGLEFGHHNHEDQLTLLTRALVGLSPEILRLYIVPSDFSRGLIHKFGRVLSEHFEINYFRIADSRHEWKKWKLRLPHEIDFLRHNSRVLHKIIAQSSNVIDEDIQVLGSGVANKYIRSTNYKNV